MGFRSFGILALIFVFDVEFVIRTFSFYMFREYGGFSVWESGMGWRYRGGN